MRTVAIDQGTSSTRGYVLDANGTGKIICTREHKQIYPCSGWVEHDPEELLRHVSDCLEAAGPVDAVAIDNQGESCLAWNADTGEAISPVLVWQDRRTENNIAKLKLDGVEAVTLSNAGLPLDPYFSASKLAWIYKNIPAARDLHKNGNLRLGTTDAFFIERLTGNYYTDITTASRTSLMNLRTGEWDQELCDLFGVPLEVLPEIRPTISDFGTLKAGGRDTPLTACVVDQQASLFGHGCREAGDAKITFGTGAFALSVTGTTLLEAPNLGLLPTVAWQETDKTPIYALDGGVYCASSALNWAKSLGLFNVFSEINQFEGVPAISRNLAFVPALTGLGCPHWDGSAAGLWLGMSLDTSAMDMVRSILEGVAFRAAEVLDAMDDRVAIGNTVSIDGGMSANPYFCQFLSDVLQKHIMIHASAEQTAHGAAMMAMGDFSSEKNGGDVGDDATIYNPSENFHEGKGLFANAVARSKGWRQFNPG